MTFLKYVLYYRKFFLNVKKCIVVVSWIICSFSIFQFALQIRKKISFLWHVKLKKLWVKVLNLQYNMKEIFVFSLFWRTFTPYKNKKNPVKGLLTSNCLQVDKFITKFVFYKNWRRVYTNKNSAVFTQNFAGLNLENDFPSFN